MNPSPQPDVITTLISIIPVVAGALIGVLGGLSGTAYANYLSSKNNSRKDLKLKLEELVTEAYEIELWLKKQESFYLFNGPEIFEKSPISRIEALAILYFPTLSSYVSVLDANEMKYKKWLLEGATLRNNSETGFSPKEHNLKVATVYNPLMSSKRELIDAAKELMVELNS